MDGNKRTGANPAITFLLINDWEPDYSDDELVELVLSVASGTVSSPPSGRLAAVRSAREPSKCLLGDIKVEVNRRDGSPVGRDTDRPSEPRLKMQVRHTSLLLI